MFEEEEDQSLTVTMSLFALINEYLSTNGYRTLRPADYAKILDQISYAKYARSTDVIETLIEATKANTSVPIRCELPDGTLRNFLVDYHGGKAILLSRNKVMSPSLAADIVGLIVSQPPAFR